PLGHGIGAAVTNVRVRDLPINSRFWTVFHGILGLGPELTLRDPHGRRVKALDYICAGGQLPGLGFRPTAHGLDVFMGQTGFSQGHQDQFVAEMAQWGMPPDRTFVVEGKTYTFLDFARQSKMRARVTAGQELSWAIIIVGQYLGTDLEWVNEAGEKLRFEDMMRYELDAPIEEAACGGTHRLFGLAWTYNLHVSRGHRPAGAWAEVPAKMRRYIDQARQVQ